MQLLYSNLAHRVVVDGSALLHRLFFQPRSSTPSNLCDYGCTPDLLHKRTIKVVSALVTTNAQVYVVMDGISPVSKAKERVKRSNHKLRDTLAVANKVSSRQRDVNLSAFANCRVLPVWARRTFVQTILSHFPAQGRVCPCCKKDVNPTTKHDKDTTATPEVRASSTETLAHPQPKSKGERNKYTKSAKSDMSTPTTTINCASTDTYSKADGRPHTLRRTHTRARACGNMLRCDQSSVRVYMADGEADGLVASVAIALGAVVLSNDSDFYIYPVISHGYVPLSTLQIASDTDGKVHVTGVQYFPQTLAKHLGLDLSDLPLLATLCGTDYVDDDISDEMHDHIVKLYPCTGRSTRLGKVIGSVATFILSCGQANVGLHADGEVDGNKDQSRVLDMKSTNVKDSEVSDSARDIVVQVALALLSVGVRERASRNYTASLNEYNLPAHLPYEAVVESPTCAQTKSSLRLNIVPIDTSPHQAVEKGTRSKQAQDMFCIACGTSGVAQNGLKHTTSCSSISEGLHETRIQSSELSNRKERVGPMSRTTTPPVPTTIAVSSTAAAWVKRLKDNLGDEASRVLEHKGAYESNAQVCTDVEMDVKGRLSVRQIVSKSGTKEKHTAHDEIDDIFNVRMGSSSRSQRGVPGAAISGASEDTERTTDSNKPVVCTRDEGHGLFLGNEGMCTCNGVCCGSVECDTVESLMHSLAITDDSEEVPQKTSHLSATPAIAGSKPNEKHIVSPVHSPSQSHAISGTTSQCEENGTMATDAIGDESQIYSVLHLLPRSMRGLVRHARVNAWAVETLILGLPFWPPIGVENPTRSSAWECTREPRSAWFRVLKGFIPSIQSENNKLKEREGTTVQVPSEKASSPFQQSIVYACDEKNSIAPPEWCTKLQNSDIPSIVYEYTRHKSSMRWARISIATGQPCEAQETDDGMNTESNVNNDTHPHTHMLTDKQATMTIAEEAKNAVRTVECVSSVMSGALEIVHTRSQATRVRLLMKILSVEKKAESLLSELAYIHSHDSNADEAGLGRLSASDKPSVSKNGLKNASSHERQQEHSQTLANSNAKSAPREICPDTVYDRVHRDGDGPGDFGVFEGQGICILALLSLIAHSDVDVSFWQARALLSASYCTHVHAQETVSATTATNNQTQSRKERRKGSGSAKIPNIPRPEIDLIHLHTQFLNMLSLAVDMGALLQTGLVVPVLHNVGIASLPNTIWHLQQSKARHIKSTKKKAKLSMAATAESIGVSSTNHQDNSLEGYAKHPNSSLSQRFAALETHTASRSSNEADDRPSSDDWLRLGLNRCDLQVAGQPRNMHVSVGKRTHTGAEMYGVSDELLRPLCIECRADAKLEASVRTALLYLVSICTQ
ncbi:hypothetical protein SARC_02375 [Sphaeroforma arctica JP610]|uniref:Asteroid domain-containing protein n=1 Tax=Sphaeroforma arctica JP610 TaxID=667725 RepID=A0A0L0GAX6_9EUKA|nr:hypothetical protein SARC_02375 [Sphaeroforma arctica JP610]KNC85423.1 hypothetical protein SARC_02375 [Sphaeroforma arctica JP610]|eukprot:XP_014159325.1 hypothetical protein SARC_02375 [Sphaeroforma arctica JP610]